MHKDSALHALATEVASTLGYTVDNDSTFDGYRGIYLDGPDGERLFFAPDWRNEKRLEVSGVYPREANNVIRVAHLNIGVGRDRGAAVIAREVTRRLLPTYTAELTRVREAVAAHGAAAAKRREAAVRIQEAFPAGQASWREDEVSVRTTNTGGWGNIRVNHAADTVSLDLHNVPTDLAVKIGELMCTWEG